MAAALCPCCRFKTNTSVYFLKRFVSATSLSCQRVQADASDYEQAVQNPPDNGGEETIVIPKRIKRNSLSILKALASTVGKDYTAPHYSYIDDPFLIPAGNAQKRNFALAKASGKRAARYFMENEKTRWCFLPNSANPHVEAFMPPKIAYEHQEPIEAALVERIKMRKVKDAIEIYEKMKGVGVTLNTDVHLQLLDLLCVYNSTDPSASLMPEEQFYRKNIGMDNQNKYKQTWNDDGAAERVFNDLPEKSSRAYCSLIRGMSKYLQTDKAHNLYKEMCDKGLKDNGTVQCGKEVWAFLDECLTGRWMEQCRLVEHLHCSTDLSQPDFFLCGVLKMLLQDMHKAEVQPDLSTFNSVLFSLSKMKHFRKSKDYALQTLTEMKDCGIEPSLGSWFYLLTVFYARDTTQSPFLNIVLDNLKDKEFTLQHPADIEFFMHAMVKCYVNQKDLELAYRIHALLSTGSNIALLGEGYQESLYYSFFFRLIFTFETMDKMMDMYDKIVPNSWTPNYSTLEELLQAVELHDGYEHLPTIWSDLILLEYMHQESLVGLTLSLMTKVDNKPELQERFADIAKYIMNRWDEDVETEQRPFFTLTGEMIGNLIVVSLRADRFSQAWDLVEFYKKYSRSFAGLLGEKSVIDLIDKCIELLETEKAIDGLSLMSELGQARMQEMRETLINKLQLTESQRKRVEALG